MEMHQVRYFLAVTRVLNFTRAADECNVSTYVENHGPSDPAPVQVRFVDRRWVPPKVRCEAVFAGTHPATVRVGYSYWYALAALVFLLCLLTLTLRGVWRLSKTRSRFD